MKTQLILILLLLLLLHVQPARAAETTQRVYLPLVVTPEVSPLPMVNEIINNRDGTCTAWWGYDNPSSNSVIVPLTGYNVFSPSPADQGQVTYFLPGLHTYLFETTWIGGDNIHWTVNEYTATAHWFTCLHPTKP